MDEKSLPELETRPLRISHVPGTGDYILEAPDNSVITLRTDEVSGGLRITSTDEDGGKLLTITPISLGCIVINAAGV